MRIGSLFSGVGGLELGIERAGVGHTVWQVEIDPFCREVLAKHWPDVERFEDVTEFEGRPADLICGGFPCQDISSAGKRAGIDGERSTLWREFARVIGLVLPRFVVVENVAALLTRGMGAVLGDLATLGYDAIWDCVPAQAVGAPHRRDRIFVVAWRIPNANGRRVREQHETWAGRRTAFTVALGAAMADADRNPLGRIGGLLDRKRPPCGDDANGCGGAKLADSHQSTGQSGTKPPQVGDTSSPRRRSGEPGPRREIRNETRRTESSRRGVVAWPPSPDDLQSWERVQADSQPSFCRMADGLPEALDRDRRKRLKALGNAVVPPVAEIIGRVILELFSA